MICTITLESVYQMKKWNCLLLTLAYNLGCLIIMATAYALNSTSAPLFEGFLMGLLFSLFFETNAIKLLKLEVRPKKESIIFNLIIFCVIPAILFSALSFSVLYSVIAFILVTLLQYKIYFIQQITKNKTFF